jgi:2-polyprenyl-3-methyl-5-hydroxy-6-metoxy-1,4-benzoquinol methylase
MHGTDSTFALDAEIHKACVIEGSMQPARFIFRKGDADIYQCPSCGCIMADTDYNGYQYDSADYYTLASAKLSDIECRWGFRSRHILGSILHHQASPDSLLDVGAGNGYFVSVAGGEFGIPATGIEISQMAVTFAWENLGVELMNGDVAKHRGKYDVVTSFNVIEHVDDPLEHLADLVRLLNPDGSLVITTPNPQCIQRLAVGLQRWKMICPPHHLNLFPLNALERLLAEFELRIMHHETLSTYVKVVRKIDTRNLLLRRLFFHTFRALGLGADHLVIAQRN